MAAPAELRWHARAVSRPDRSAQITLRTLVTARWVLLTLLAATGVMIAVAPDALGPLRTWLPERPGTTAFIALLLGWSLVNLATDRLVLARGLATQTIAGAHLLVDAAFLTVLLGLSGGATNAFTTLYFLPITLATQVSPRWTWALAGFCLACFAALFLLHPIPQGPPGHEAHFAGHLRGMWVAFAVSGGLITYFVHRIALSLSRQREELVRLHEQGLEDRHLGALGSLAAGAAHELGTPLGSIELLVADLPHMEGSERDAALATVRGEVARCKTILQRMASPELRVATLGEEGGPAWRLSALEDDLEAQAGDVAVEIASHVDDAETTQPREVLGQIVRELVANAMDATRRRARRGPVRVRIETNANDASISIDDEGTGMDPAVAARAFDPFFSTKAEGMGLGLYLARAQVRQLGGRLELQTAPERGTTVRLVMPLRPPAPRTVP